MVKACIIGQTIANDAPLQNKYTDVQNLRVRVRITDQAGDFSWSGTGITQSGQQIKLSGTFAAEDGEGVRVVHEGSSTSAP